MIDLFRSENVVVRSVPAGDVSRWVVTFDNYGIGHGFDRPGFGEEFFRQSGVSAIHVLGRQEDWYQYPEMAEAMAAVLQATKRAERVMTYGSSMGGYAALRFADAAGANAVLAVSPQYSIDPQKVPFEKRWLQDSRRIRWLPEIDGRLMCAVRPVVVFDPVGEDGRQTVLIQREIDIIPIPLPHVSHPATTYLGEVGLLSALVFETLSGELDAGAFTQRARSARKKSGVYVSNLALAQPQHRGHLALKLARRSVEVSPHNTLAGAALARLLSRQGHDNEAIKLLENILACTGRDINYLVPYVDVLIAAGRYGEATAHAREAVEASPQQAHLHAWEGAVLWGAGQFSEAVAAVERAVTLDPYAKRYRNLLKVYRQKKQPLSSHKLSNSLGRALVGLWPSLRSRDQNADRKRRRP